MGCTGEEHPLALGIIRTAEDASSAVRCVLPAFDAVKVDQPSV